MEPRANDADAGRTPSPEEPAPTGDAPQTPDARDETVPFAGKWAEPPGIGELRPFDPELYEEPMTDEEISEILDES